MEDRMRRFIDRMNSVADDPEALAFEGLKTEFAGSISHSVMLCYSTIFALHIAGSDKLRDAPIEKLSQLLKAAVEYQNNGHRDVVRFMIASAQSATKRLEIDLGRLS